MTSESKSKVKKSKARMYALLPIARTSKPNTTPSPQKIRQKAKNESRRSTYRYSPLQNLFGYAVVIPFDDLVP